MMHCDVYASIGSPGSCSTILTRCSRNVNSNKQLTFSSAFFTIDDELEHISLCQNMLFPRVTQYKPGALMKSARERPVLPIIGCRELPPVCHRYLL